MNGRIRKVLFVGISALALLVVMLLLRPGAFAFFAMQADGVRLAGVWEDDANNWQRAFNAAQPAEIKVVHSKYWRSNHFTEEFIYYFEIEASAEWKAAFLKERALAMVSASEARSFRAGIHSGETPDWFAPDPVGLYDVWDQAGRFGSVWISKANGHLYFYGMQL